MSNHIFVDLEHTGGTQRHILELAVVDSSGKTLFNQRIKPPKSVYYDKKSMQLWNISANYCHKIYPKNVQDCKELDIYMPQLREIFAGKILVAHNASCELSILPQELVDSLSGNFCTYKSFMTQYPKTKSGLGPALSFAGITLQDAHTALADAIGCMDLFYWLTQPKGQGAFDL